MDPGESWDLLAQLRRGMLPYLVLAILDRDPCYGLALVKNVSEVEGMVTSEGTIYPLLARLRRRELVTTSWQESPAGPPRRYYQLTARGEEVLEAFRGDWARLRSSVDRALEGVEEGEQ